MEGLATLEQRQREREAMRRELLDDCAGPLFELGSGRRWSRVWPVNAATEDCTGPTARVSPARVTRYDAGRGGSARRCLAAPCVFGWRRAHKRRRPASDGAAHCSYPGSRYSGHVRQHLARMQFSFVSDTQAIPAVQNLLQPLGS